MRLFSAFTNRVTLVSGFIGGIIAMLIAFIIGYDIFERYFFNTPTTWVVEFTQYFVAFVVLVGASYTSIKKGHVTVDFLATKLSKCWQKRLGKVSAFISLLYVGIFLWQSALFWWGAYSTGERSWGILSVPLAIPYAFFVLGMLFLLVTEGLNFFSEGG